MKIKNKKILTRLSAVLATCLLLVALAVPCFADETEQTQYVLTEVTFSTTEEMLAFLVDEYEMVSHIIVADSEKAMIAIPTLAGFDDQIPTCVYVNTVISGQDSIAINATTSVTVSYGGAIMTSVQGYVNSNFSVNSVEMTPEEIGYLDITVYAYVPAELTPAPIDPDAPTRTGLYGELYHIIRDAIYGENAFLDSTQEFTLTQIATWMTYIVILLPLVVIAIILFKIFVR